MKKFRGGKDFGPKRSEKLSPIQREKTLRVETSTSLKSGGHEGGGERASREIVNEKEKKV